MLKERERKAVYGEMKREEEERKKKEEKIRRQRQMELESAQQKLIEEKQVTAWEWW